MIDLSDEEDEVEVKSKEKKMGKIAGRVKSSLDDDDDVCVIGEMSYYKKFPRGAVLAHPRAHDRYAVQIGNIRRRKKTDTGTTVKYCTLRRNFCPNSYRSLCDSSLARRELYGVGEAIRLEERKTYMELIQAIFRYEMMQAYNILVYIFRTYLPQIWQTFQNFQPLRTNQFVQPHVNPIRGRKRTSPPKVESVDLDSDSDNDVVEVPREPTSSKESVASEGDNEILVRDDVIEVDEESESSCSSVQVSSKNQSPELEIEACSSSTHIEQIPDEDDTFINLVDDDEEDDDEDLGCTSTDPSFKGNLADQMIQQMTINEESQVPGGNEKASDEEDSDDEESLPELTLAMQQMVREAFNRNSKAVLVEAFNLTILVRDLRTLDGNNWLNDQVINFYMSLLMERGKLGSYPSVYCFNTFFFVKLVSFGHASLKRWTKTVDVFSYDILIIPVHMKVHWCLAAVNFIEKKIEYYDSMRDNNNDHNFGEVLLKYLQDEHLDKKNEAFNISGWEIVIPKDIPEQLNGCDCGVFACTYAEYVCRLTKLTFTQQHMQYFRVKMAYEILTKRLLL